MINQIVNAIPVRMPVTSSPLIYPSTTIPNIAGQWSSYTITQVGRSVVIESDNWCASGWVQMDNSIILWWVSGNGNFALGLYKLNSEGILHGEWGYVTDGVSVEDGVIRGKVIRSDTIWPGKR